jgi:hypothetical protein
MDSGRTSTHLGAGRQDAGVRVRAVGVNDLFLYDFDTNDIYQLTLLTGSAGFTPLSP